MPGCLLHPVFLTRIMPPPFVTNKTTGPKWNHYAKPRVTKLTFHLVNTLGSLRSRLKPVHQSPDQHSSSGDLPAGRPAHPLFPKGKELCGNQPTFLPRKLPCSHSRLPVGSFTVPSPWSAFPSTELNAAGFESIFVQISS